MNHTSVIAILICKIIILGSSTRLDKKSKHVGNTIARDMLDDVIINNGYKSETHSVLTPDGHILPLYRIPYSKKTGGKKRWGQPVLFMPGIFLSASSFFFVSAEQALPFLLADVGYDVWIGNYRGCEGTKHESLSKKTLGYWKFTIDDIAKYDFTSNIDYILEKTNRTDLDYVGYSMGGTMAFFALSAYPSYNTKIRKMVGMATAAHLHLSNTFFGSLGLVNLPLLVMKSDFWFGGKIPLDLFQKPLKKAAKCCSKLGLLQTCAELLVATMSPSRANKEIIDRLLNHAPSPVSARVLAQIGGIVKRGVPSKYNRGKKGNLRKFGSQDSPVYNLKKITVPCFIINGLNDQVFFPEDVNKTFNELGSKSKTLKFVKDFNHVDFILDNDVKKLAFRHVGKYLLK